MNNLVNKQPFSETQLTTILNALKTGSNLEKASGEKLSACELANVDRKAFKNLMESNPKIQEMVNNAKKVGDNLPIVLVADFDIDSFSMEVKNLNNLETGNVLDLVLEEEFNDDI